MKTKVNKTLVATAAIGRFSVPSAASRPPNARLIRAHVSIAAKVRMGAGSMEYWKWKAQKFGDEDQKRSRNDGSATTTRGEKRGSVTNAANAPSHTRVLAAGLKSSSRLAIG